MTNTLLQYFNQRFEKKIIAKSKLGPFITISRQTGCNGTGIAIDLVKALKARNKVWRFINKDILEKSANKLGIDKSKIHYVFKSQKKSHIDDVLSALSSKYYKSDRIVRKTITEVLQYFAKTGNVIIVGRAGVATTASIKNGLHLRLTAPYEWRLNSLKRRKGFENMNVAAFIKKHDLKKTKLIEDFCEKKISDIHFDLTINCAAFTRQQIISIILKTLEMKNLI